MTEQRRRNPLPPTKLPQPQYEAEMWDHLKTREGMANRVYTDDKGIPTMGVGVALAVEGEGKKFVLRSPEEIGVEISGDKNAPYRFKPDEWQRLEQTVGTLNDPNLKERDRLVQARKLIPAFSPGKDAPENNKFGFTLSDERMKSQAFDKLPEYREAALKTVKQEALKRGWSEHDANAYVEQMRSSRQEGALTSMRYNGVAAPKASGGMVDGDRATVRNEILYGSNPPKNGNSRVGIAARRRDEADMATGNPAGWTPEEQAKWRGYEGTPQAQDYRRQFPDAFKDRPGTPAPSAPSSPQGNDAIIERMKTTPPMQVGTPPAPLPTASEWPQVDSSAFPGAQEAPKPEEPGWWDKAKEFIPSLTSPAQGGTLPGSDGMAPPAASGNSLVAVKKEELRYLSDAQKAMLEMSATPLANPGRMALLKPVEKLTQSEMMEMINSAQGDYRGWRSGDPLKAHTYEKVQDWHAAMYGDGPQGNDGGKPIEPMPIRAIPDQSAPMSPRRARICGRRPGASANRWSRSVRRRGWTMR